MAITWKRGAQFKVDAEVAHQQIDRIYQKKGSVVASDVVKLAKGVRNPLHPEFEWDDEVAANEHRLETARSLLRSFHVVRDEVKSDRPQRVFEIVTEKAEGEKKARKVYKTTEDVMADPDMRSELLFRALRELRTIQQRFRDLQELAVVMRAIDEVAETIDIS